MVCICLCAWPAWGAEKSAPPQWIWLSKSDAQETVYLRKAIELPENMKYVTVAAACDNAVTLYVNDKKVLQQEGWSNAGAADLADAIHSGLNVFAAECRNDGGPAGMILQLSVELLDGKKLTMVSDETWRASATAPDGWRKPDFDAKDWKQVVSVGKWGDKPWGKVDLAAGPAAGSDAGC